MHEPPCTLYIIECRTPRHWYVGTTYREARHRFAEHRAGYGCKWTRKHGFKKVSKAFRVPLHGASALENDVWMHLARQYGPNNVRGGDVTIVHEHTDEIPDWCLPREFGGSRVVDWGLPALRNAT